MSAGARWATGLRSLFGSVGGVAYELTTADAAVRAALPLSRRVGVVSVDGGSGTTAVATALSSLLGRRRSGPVLAVDGAGGHAGLADRLLGGEGAHGTTEAAAERLTARNLSQATTGLPRSGTGAHVLDLADSDRRATPVPDWSRQVTPIARFFDLVITDWGVRPAAMDLTKAAATSHVLMMVGRSDRHSATRAAVALASARDQVADCIPLLVLADVSRTADRIAEPLGRALRLEPLLLPYEPLWSADRPSQRSFSGRSRRAHIRLAVTVMTEAVRSQRPSTGSDAGETQQRTTVLTT